MMFQKWKLILTNWINCYCNERGNEEVDINTESLLAIISYLRKNLSLDDSRSSLLEAHTIQEFVLEKYPGFKFENNTSEPTSEDDLYMSASLLLYFVCVNSKNIDLKNAMCSKLSASDQEIILKFSKCLMGCPNISSADVLTAIAEACGQDIAGADTVSSNIIAETPPALRSLHSEVRRLQAALDAERFDRTYLQEELSRTNLKLEKISKVKEQYKLEIVTLKSKVSECCGEDNSTNGNETSHNNSIKLARQLEQTEERLATVQEELSNAEYERNTYKNKLDDLKRDRDKYLALSQQENIRACQLAEELEVERRQTSSLRELVTELRQHNRLNGFDTSQLECDDLDTSLHSLLHNSSVCSEACANVIEVQLSEERAKINAMKHQIQMLQDQLKDLGNKYENEQKTFSEILSDKESNILNLKHRINEEIEKKNLMKSKYDDDITKLNNEINELEQILKDTTENSRKIIDTKLQEIQILQEEKLSLLQSFSNETTKLNNIVQGLKSEIEGEKNSKHKMREDYDNHIMKLNEKVSNRSDELVKLQDKIVEKGEEIENLQLQLRSEKDMRQELINKHNNDALHYNNLIKELNYNAQQNLDQINNLKKQVQQYYQCVEEMKKDRNDLNTTIVSLKEEINNLAREKQAWIKEREKIQFEFDEKNETVNSLKSQLQTEIEFKNEVQSKLYEMELLVESLTGKNADLEENLEKNNNDIKLLEDEVRTVKEEQEKIVNEFESERLEFMNKEVTMESTYKNEKNKFDEKLSEADKCNEILQEKVKCLEKERCEAEKRINEKVTAYEIISKDFNDLKKQNDIVCESIKKLNTDLSESTTKVERLNIEKNNLELVIQRTGEALRQTKSELKTTVSSGIKKILENLTTEGINCDVIQKLKADDSDELQNSLGAIIETVIVLTKDLSLHKNLEKTLEQKNIAVEKLTDLVKQKDNKVSQLQDEVNNLQQLHHTLKIEWSTKTEEYKRLLEEKVKEVEDLESQNKTLHSELNDVKIQLDTKIYSLKDKLIENENITDKLKTTYECQIDNLNVMVSKLTDFLREKANEIEALNKDKVRLEETIQDNNKAIKLLEKEIKSQKLNHEKLISEFESERVVLKNVVSVTESVMEDQKLSLNNKIIEQVKLNETLKEQLSNLEESIEKEQANAESKLNDKMVSLNEVTKELAKVKQEKMILEENMRKLEINWLEKTEQMESIVEEKNNWMNILKSNKEEIMLLERQKQEYEVEKEQQYNYIHNLEGLQETILQEKELLLKHLEEEKNQRLSQLGEIHKLQQLQAENVLLHTAVQEKESAIKLLEDELGTQKAKHEKFVNEFESERAVLKNMVTVTESVMEDQKLSLDNKIIEQVKQNETLKEQVTRLEEQIQKERTNAEIILNDKLKTLEALGKELADTKQEKVRLEENIRKLERSLSEKTEETESIRKEKNILMQVLESNKEVLILLEKQKRDYESEKQKQYESIRKLESLHETVLQEKELLFKHLQEKDMLLEEEKTQSSSQLGEIHKLQQLQAENKLLNNAVQEKESAIKLLEEEIRSQKDSHEKLVNEFESERAKIQNMALVTENQKLSFDNKIEKQIKLNETLKEQLTKLKEEIEKERTNGESKLNDKLASLEAVLKADVKEEKKILEENAKIMEGNLLEKTEQMEILKEQITRLEERIEKERTNGESKLNDKLASLEAVVKELADVKQEKTVFEENTKRMEGNLLEKTEQMEILKEQITRLEEQIEKERTNGESKLNDKLASLEAVLKELADVKQEKTILEENAKIMESNLLEKTEQMEMLKEQITRLEEQIEKERTNGESKLNDKLASLEAVLKELADVKQEKTILEENAKRMEGNLLEKTEQMEILKEQITRLEEQIEKERTNGESKLHDKLASLEAVLKELADVKQEKTILEENDKRMEGNLLEKTEQMEILKEQITRLEEQIEKERTNGESKLHDKLASLEAVLKELADVKQEKTILEENAKRMEGNLLEKTEQMEILKEQITRLEEQIEEEQTNGESKLNDKLASLEAMGKELADTKQEKVILEENVQTLERNLLEITEQMKCIVEEKNNIMNILENNKEELQKLESFQVTVLHEKELLLKHLEEKDMLLEEEKNQRLSQLDEIQKLQQLQAENVLLHNAVQEKELEINAIKEHLKNINIQKEEASSNNKMEQTNLVNKCDILQEYQSKAEEELTRRQEEIEVLQEEIKSLRQEYERVADRDVVIEKLNTELEEARKWYLHYQQEAEKLNIENEELRERLDVAIANVYSSRKEKCALANKENITPKYREEVEVKIRELQNQVHDSAFDNTATSTDSCKTINDLEKIIQDKNRIITTLHSEITYLKTLIAESENKLLDVSKDLDLSRENCHQLSSQLKKVVHQKNEEISELKKQITKMSATETRATQIIKVSAKYQAMILKRIAEIKSNTVLKELTNFGNSNGDNEIRRSFNAGNITMEDLENFLETTDRHLRRCSEKQIALQKERDRLLEVNKIHDSEIISMRKFLTELSVSIKTFNSVKDLYSQKLNRVIALQRTVRREILNLDGRITDATMCKLERGYAAIMQDLSECALNLERWVDRSIVRSISPEKIKQAFISDVDGVSLVTTSFQNTSLEIQLGELESSFQKLLEEAMRAQTGDGAKDVQAVTLMEVRAEYEDKLSRMKAKMKELYIDQITQFKNKQKEEIEELENKLQRANEKLQEVSKAYQDHIRGLTTELWNVGEKFIIQKDEAQWLRKQQKSGSLMSLQHVHSTGLAAPHDEPHRPSDTHSLRSLPVDTNKKDKKEGRGLHMSDEEGEVFDNRCLRELAETPRRARAGAGAGAGTGRGEGARLSELRWRNSLCPPHLKSSYPAETQFAPALQEEEIKWTGTMSLGGKQQRKEVGITAYKKPGPPTPSKQAGRLSATDSELRESLRVEVEPGARRTATPSRLFGLFRSKHDTVEGTPRSRRLSNIFRKK